MKIHLLNKITIIIPTHNREKYLTRILDFYSPYNLNIVIVDSSDKKFEIEEYSNPNIRYFYNRRGKASDKWFNALNYVNTEYVCYCADDDFIFIDSLIESLEFLIKNPDYSSAQGRQLFYKYFYMNNEIEYDVLQEAKNLIPNISNIHNSSDNIEERFDKFCFPYRNPLYGVFKLNTLKKIYQGIKKYGIYEGFASEVCVAALAMIYGKTIELDNIYNLMEYIPSSCAKILKDIPTLCKEDSIDIQNSKKLISAVLLENDFDINKANILSEKIFDDLLYFIEKMKIHHREKQIIKCSSIENNRTLLEDKYLSKIYKKQSYLKTIENKIIKHSINSGHLYKLNNDNYNLSINLNLFINKLESIFHEIKKQHSKIILYGAGNIGNIISLMYSDYIYYIIDKNQELSNFQLNNKYIYNLNHLKKDCNYDFILISVLGRENEITLDLINNYTIPKDKIICI